VWQKLPEKHSLSLVSLQMKSNVGGATLNRKVRALEAKSLCNALQYAIARAVLTQP
jgi:hypothetical protein